MIARTIYCTMRVPNAQSEVYYYIVASFLSYYCIEHTMQQLVLESFSSHGYFWSIYFLGHRI